MTTHAAAPKASKSVVVISQEGWIKRWRWVLLGLLTILIAGGGFWWWHAHHKKTLPADAVTASQLGSIQNQASAAAQGPGGAAAGLLVYNRAIARAADKTTKANLELQAAGLAFSNNLLDTALPLALDADNILHKPDSSNLVATIYQQKGNDSQAIKFYNKAADEVSSHQISGENKFYYQNEAKQLSGAKN